MNFLSGKIDSKDSGKSHYFFYPNNNAIFGSFYVKSKIGVFHENLY